MAPLGRVVCLRMGCLTGCNCVAHMPRFVCVALCEDNGYICDDTMNKEGAWSLKPLYSALLFSDTSWSLRPVVVEQETKGCVINASCQLMIMTIPSQNTIHIFPSRGYRSSLRFPTKSSNISARTQLHPKMRPNTPQRHHDHNPKPLRMVPELAINNRQDQCNDFIACAPIKINNHACRLSPLGKLAVNISHSSLTSSMTAYGLQNAAIRSPSAERAETEGRDWVSRWVPTYIGFRIAMKDLHMHDGF